VDIRVVPKGQTFEQIVRGSVRTLETATRKVGRDVAKVGKKALADGAGTFRGKKLTASTKQQVSGRRTTVIFHAKPAGAWAIKESGAKAHQIKPKRAHVLSFDGIYAAHVSHPGARGHQAWTQAGDRLESAVEPAIEDDYDEAFT
jgi:phosphopantetheinyl transferase (holo-ACP synthase)